MTEQRTVVITGATRGIGKALVGDLARPGARLVLVGRSTGERPDKRLPGTLEESAELARERGAEVVTHAVDLAAPDEVAGLARLLAAEPVDVLVNNAAISYVGPFLEVAPERWRRTLAVNLVAPVELMHAVLPGMLARRRGVVVNVGSAAAHVDAVPQLPYSASKLGLERLTTGLAAQMGSDAATGVAVVLVRIDEVVVTEAVHLSAPQLVTPESTSAESFARALRWVIEHPDGLHGQIVGFDDLRALGVLAG